MGWFKDLRASLPQHNLIYSVGVVTVVICSCGWTTVRDLPIEARSAGRAHHELEQLREKLAEFRQLEAEGKLP